MASWRGGDPQSHKAQHPSLPHSSRHWVPQGHASLAPVCVYAALALLISATHALAQHHYPYLPSRQSGKSVVPAAVSATLFSKAPVTHFQCSLANHPLPPSLPAEPMLRITATWYHMLSGGHRLPPFSRASFTSWVSCQLHQLYR